MVRVDYRCGRCGLVAELVMDTPTAAVRCAGCGGTAKRQWTGFGIGRRDHSGAAIPGQPTAPPSQQGAGAGGELCRSNPGVPGLCLLGQSAGRALVARAANDGRSLEREQRRQTDFLSETGRHGTVVSDHGHSHRGGGRAGGNGPREIC